MCTHIVYTHVYTHRLYTCVHTSSIHMCTHIVYIHVCTQCLHASLFGTPSCGMPSHRAGALGRLIYVDCLAPEHRGVLPHTLGSISPLAVSGRLAGKRDPQVPPSVPATVTFSRPFPRIGGGHTGAPSGIIQPPGAAPSKATEESSAQL